MLPAILAYIGDRVQKDLRRTEDTLQLTPYVDDPVMQHDQESAMEIITFLNGFEGYRQRTYTYFISTLCDLYVAAAENKRTPPVSNAMRRLSTRMYV